MNFLLLLMVFEKIELVLPAKTYAAPCRAEVAGPVEKMQQSLFINRPFLNFLAVN